MPLTDKQDQEQVKLLRTFSSRPLQSLVDSKHFFVEFDEIKKIRLAIKTNENALIIGERGSGKTSLLNYLNYSYQNENSSMFVIPIHFSVSRLEKFNQTNFLKILINSIFEDATKFRTGGEKLRNVMDKLIVSPERDNVEPFPITLEGNVRYGRKDANFETLSERLKALIHTLKKRNVEIFVMIDDTDKIDTDIVWKAFRGIRDLLWDLRVSFLLSCLPEQVSEITKPPLDQFFPYWIKMKSFDDKMAKELIYKRIQYVNSKIQIDNEALKQVVTNTKGNPRRIVSMIKNVIESNQNIHTITSKIIENLGLPYSFELNDIESAVIDYLSAHPNTSASNRDFVEKIGVKRSRIAQILNELKGRNLINSEKDGQKMIYFISRKGLMKKKN